MGTFGNEYSGGGEYYQSSDFDGFDIKNNEIFAKKKCQMFLKRVSVVGGEI